MAARRLAGNAFARSCRAFSNKPENVVYGGPSTVRIRRSSPRSARITVPPRALVSVPQRNVADVDGIKQRPRFTLQRLRTCSHPCRAHSLPCVVAAAVVGSFQEVQKGRTHNDGHRLRLSVCCSRRPGRCAGCCLPQESARLRSPLCQAGIDCLLVGDSAAMVCDGDGLAACAGCVQQPVAAGDSWSRHNASHNRRRDAHALPSCALRRTFVGVLSEPPAARHVRATGTSCGGAQPVGSLGAVRAAPSLLRCFSPVEASGARRLL